MTAKVPNDEHDGLATAFPANFGEIAGSVVNFDDPHPMYATSREAGPRYAFKCNFCESNTHEETKCWKKYHNEIPKALCDKQSSDESKSTEDTSENSDTAETKKHKRKSKKSTKKQATAYGAETGEGAAMGLWGFSTFYANLETFNATVDGRDPRMLSIDTCANVLFCSNKSLLRNNKKVNYVVNGVGGTTGVSAMGTLPGFGKAVYIPSAGIRVAETGSGGHKEIG